MADFCMNKDFEVEKNILIQFLNNSCYKLRNNEQKAY
jgi:hypothetical protein